MFKHMPRHTALLSLAAALTIPALTGCAQQAAKANSEPAPAASEQSNAATPSADGVATIELFEQLITSAQEASELLAFLDEHIGDASQEHADAMIRGLLAFYEEDLEKTSEAYYGSDVQEALLGLGWPIAAERLEAIEDEAIRELALTKAAGGYKLETAEGMIYPVVDYGMLKKYADRLSPALKDYLALLALESDDKMASDAALIIGWDELAERGVAYEAYLVQYPDAPETERAKEMYHTRFLMPYLYGLNNTPVFDFDTFRLLDEVKASYEKTVQAYPDTITAQIVSGFLDALEASDWQVFEKVDGQQADVEDVKTYREGARTQFEMRLDSKGNGK
ncbi:hypothetical protein FE782_25840 [Paenibacillus antri]|uniref:Lipoprotein n=1 Tax=Paenibacillus antri TaxID=2582848 RepID=A0A5R9G0I5_9BACL|nr:hypothetical protein [Paenibacillus antri]TLS49281.1 hypothetical protein FE782_25840 [Paenibacillus antri]